MKFEEYLHPEFIKLIEKIHLQGFKVGVVGGTCRDFLLGSPNKHDYDCELRPLDLDVNLLNSFANLLFPSEFKQEKLPYNILKLTHTDFTVELTLPRVEVYSHEFSHSNFSAEFSGHIDYKEAVLRRDFTINSIIYEFNGNWEIIDPLNGRKDLEKNVLRPCGVDFPKDPVRFLRAVRFKTKYNSLVDKNIISWAKHINIEEFSSHYLRLEASKSEKPLVFMINLFALLGIEYETKFEDFLFSNETMKGTLKEHLNSMCFVEKEFINFAIEAFDFSLKPLSITEPILFRALQKLELEEFIQQELEFNLVKKFKFISTLKPDYINFLINLGLLDIDHSCLVNLNKYKPNLDDVEVGLRSTVSFYRKLKNVRFD